MKNTTPQTLKSPALRKLAAVALLAVLGASSAMAEFVYVTSTPSNCVATTDCGNVNTDFNADHFYSRIYDDSGFGDFTTAIAVAVGKPLTPGARYFSMSFSNTTPDFGVTLNPRLYNTGGVYKIYHTYTSINGNVSTNIVVGFTNYEGCTLSFTNSDKFQAAFGNPVSGVTPWQFLGYLTNDPGVFAPVLHLYFADGDVDAGAQKRLLFDTFLFTDDACTAVPQLGMSGSYIVTSTNATVTGVATNATAIKVYQYAAGTWTLIGTKTTGITGGNNTVTISGLVKGGQLAATQVINGQEGCLWGIPTGVIVGTPNPRVRLALSLRETSSTGPVGASGSTASGNLHFLGATNRFGGAPGLPSRVLYPSNSVWQTVTFQRGPDYANPVDHSIKWNSASGDPFPTGTLDCITSNWCVLDALAFAIDDLTQTGPWDIYIDVLQNGTTIWQTFENYPAGQTGVGVQAPGYSGSTSGNLAGPNSSVVANNAAFDGIKSQRLQWAFNGTLNTKWVRVTTSGAGNPQVNMNDPITFKFLMVPDGGTYPAPPPAPTLSASLVNGQAVLSYTGAHRVQTAVDVTGPYTTVGSQTNGTFPYLAPWTNIYSDPTRFFRLVD